VKFIKKLLILVSFCLLGCAHNDPDFKQDHQEFLRNAERARSKMNKKIYRNWLNRKLKDKQALLQAISGEEDREEKIYGQQEMLDSSSATSSAGPNVHAFEARSSAQKMYHYSEQRKVVEKEVFYLKSQLTALENHK